jgi:hypothetical protein
MGVSLGFGTSEARRPASPDPIPSKFKILSRTDFDHGISIVLVKYEGCTTFNGLKLLVTKGLEAEPQELDPHLLGEGHVVVARFEPNSLGSTLATGCAMTLAAPFMQVFPNPQEEIQHGQR